ncbi:MAG: hypothetical protein XD63_0608 [Thermoanaerobacterales bacterium 50_218]|nr:MAG: hypothetical protein XD63_0608 [Thermoanaerobacterales bacterium 50_218]
MLSGIEKGFGKLNGFSCVSGIAVCIDFFCPFFSYWGATYDYLEFGGQPAF